MKSTTSWYHLGNHTKFPLDLHHNKQQGPHSFCVTLRRVLNFSVLADNNLHKIAQVKLFCQCLLSKIPCTEKTPLNVYCQILLEVGIEVTW